MNHPNINSEKKLKTLVDALDIPRSYYEKATQRYKSIGEWFCRPESTIKDFDPVVYPQGSFRYGTVVRPLAPCDEYDLDIVCELTKLGKTKLTQKQLKEMVGNEVKAYAAAHNIQKPVRERTRCWRLDYTDEVDFHIDVLGCVPEDAHTILRIQLSGVEASQAAMAIGLTCKKDENYEKITSDWPTSNPGGYGVWFENQMKVVVTEKRRLLVAEHAYASVEEVPTYALKTPLQQCIQLLKRHRDLMFADNREKMPISMIITTLAARAYQGERSLTDAMNGILTRMSDHVLDASPRIANPSNPGEDFANKWEDDPELEDNFDTWLSQARKDFANIAAAGSATEFRKLAQGRLEVRVSEKDASDILPNINPIKPAAAPIVMVSREAPKSWKRNA